MQHFERALHILFAAGVGSGDFGGFHRQGGHEQQVMRLQGGIVGRSQSAGHVLGLGVIMAVIVLLHIAAEQDDHFDGFRQVVRAGEPSARRSVEQAGGIMPLPVGAHAAAFDHQQGRAFGRNAVPDMPAIAVPGQGYGRNRSPEFLKCLGRFSDTRVYVRFRHVPAKAFFDHANPQPADISAEGLGICLTLETRLLARVQSVRAGQNLKQQGGILHAARHRSGMIQRNFNRHNAGIRNQAVGRFMPVDTAPRGRHTNRAALVAPNRHIDHTGRNQRSATARRAAGGAAVVMRVEHRTGSIGMTAPGEA